MNLIDLKERIVIASLAHRNTGGRPATFTVDECNFLLDAINATPQAQIAAGDAEMIKPPNYMGRIESIWAWLSVDDGGEGVVAAPLGNQQTVPLIAADRQRLDAVTPIAKQVARVAKLTIRLAKFSKREDVETFRP